MSIDYNEADWAAIRESAARKEGRCICGKDGYPLNAMSCPIHGDKRPAIASELYTTLERLGASPELLSIVGSWHDTLSDAEVLAALKDYNATGKVLHGGQ